MSARLPASRYQTASTLGLMLLAVYLLSAPLRLDSGDGEAMYQVTRSLVEGRGVVIPAPDPKLEVITESGEVATVSELEPGDWWPYGAPGVDGRYYSKYGIGWSIAAIPFYALGAQAAHLAGTLSEGYLSRACVTVLNAFAVSCTAGLLFLVACRFFAARDALLLALMYGLATIVWIYAQGAASEPLVALGLTWAVLCGLKAEEQRHPLWWGLAGVGLGWALLARPSAAVAILPLGLWALVAGRLVRGWRGGVANLVAAGIPLVLAVAVTLAYNVVRFGSLLDFGYPGSVWRLDSLVGFYGLLASPGKGVLVFAPVTILGLAGWPRFLRRHPLQGGTILSIVVLYVVVYAFTLRDWEGGASWGPRHMVPILGFLLLPAGAVIGQAKQNRAVELAVGVLLAVGLVIQLLGTLVTPHRHLQRTYAQYPDYASYFQQVNLSWADSPLLGQVQSLREIVSLARQPGSKQMLQDVVAAEMSQDAEEGQAQAVQILAFNVPDLWFVYWGFLGVSVAWRWAGFLILLGLLVCSAAHLRAAMRGTPDLELGVTAS